MTDSCILCQNAQPDGELGLCSYCTPNTCYKCHVDSVSVENNEFKCSHGCQYDVHEYTTRKLYTTLLNGTWREKLALAGTHIEYIIPQPERITVHKERPQLTDGILGLHYTSSPTQLAEEGFDRSLERENNEKYYSNTIRETAAYAWPYTSSFTETEMSWQSEYVFFEIPSDAVYVSSYRFLNFVQDDGRWGIPIEKYDSELTFTPDQLFRVCEEKRRPADLETLLFKS